MAGAMRMTIFMFLFLIVFVVGGILLQIFLSKRESQWIGLVLPAITFLWSILMVLNVAAVNDVGAVISVLIIGNLPTLILLAIHAACRENRKKRAELDKMRINDL